MQKHQRKQPSRARRNIATANFELNESAANTVFGVVNSIVGGENPALAYLRDQFQSKYCDESLVSSAERRRAAIDKLVECEEANAVTNSWFRNLDKGFNILPRVTMSRFLRFARDIIRDVLGPLRDEVVLGSFSGGASTSRGRARSHPALKFASEADITEEAMCVLPVLYRLAPMLREYGIFDHLNVVEGNVLFTVPKKTDIDRCACKEPDVNMFLQKGVGRHIRRRLQSVGINLNDQSINRAHARTGSIDGSLATLDLSSASDRISLEVVATLLPKVWFEYLNSIRSQNMVIDGETFRTEMFSSMGNGFTFELESLIFYSLCRATLYFEGIPGILSVYGDDIIIPSQGFDAVTFVLNRFGFVVNVDKSFHTGDFRESCGGHYLNGEDVTPFYLKRKATHLTDVIRVANQLRRWSFNDPFRRYEMPGLYATWRTLADLVPKELWGGYDTELDTKLATAPGGSHILKRVREPVRVPDSGQYLLWHNSNWNRTRPPEADGAASSTNQICRLKRAPLGAPVCEHIFIEEML
jgi:hypothetical protein